MAFNIGEMFVRLTADTSEFQRQMQNAQRSAGAFGSAASQAGGEFAKLRGPLTALATQLSGVNSTFARLASTMLQLASGGAVAVRVIAGVAAVTAAYKLMRRGVDEATDAIEKQNKELEESKKRLDEIAKERAGGERRLQMLTDVSNALSEAAELEKQLTAKRAQAAAPGAGLRFDFPDLQREIVELAAKLELAKREARDGAAALAEFIPTLDVGAEVTADALETFTKKLGDLKFKAAEAAAAVEEMMADIFDVTRRPGPGFNAGAAAARESLREKQQAGRLSDFERKLATLGELIQRRTTQDRVPGGGPLDNAVRGFGEAVDAFKSGVDSMIEGAFSAGGLANIGANLASQGLGFIASKAFDHIAGIFKAGTDKLAEALRQNSEALRASSDFLSKRLAEAGLTDEAQKLAPAIRNAMDRIALLGGTSIEKSVASVSIFLDELKKAGLSWDQARKVAETLGIDISRINFDTLDQFSQQLQNAGVAVEDFAETIGETLRNIPEIWNAALGRFRAQRAAGMTAPTSYTGGTGGTIDQPLAFAGPGAQYAFTGNIVLPGVRSGKDFYREVRDEAVRVTARGGSPVIPDDSVRRVV